MPHRQAGWALPNGHIVRSQSEAALCDFLTQLQVAHDHWALNFEVPASPTEWHLYIPSIRLTEITIDDRAVIVEPINSLQIGGGLRRLEAFRKHHGRNYYVIVVTRRVLHHRLPEDAYDAICHLEDFEGLREILKKANAAPRQPPAAEPSDQLE